ncbi:MAG: hypothetical protein ACI9SP_000075 [Arenicella sp.]|jgi:hypothetical protein
MNRKITTKVSAILSFVVLSFFSTTSFAWCITWAKVEQLRIGNNSESINGLRSMSPRRQTGHDGNNAVVIVYRDNYGAGSLKYMPLNTSYNLNDANGRAMYSMLQTALTTGLLFHAQDDYGTRCDDINQISLVAP